MATGMLGKDYFLVFFMLLAKFGCCGGFAAIREPFMTRSSRRRMIRFETRSRMLLQRSGPYQATYRLFPSTDLAESISWLDYGWKCAEVVRHDACCWRTASFEVRTSWPGIARGPYRRVRTDMLRQRAVATTTMLEVLAVPNSYQFNPRRECQDTLVTNICWPEPIDLTTKH